MSTDYYLIKSIPICEIRRRTKLNVVEKTRGYDHTDFFIQDEFGDVIHVVTDGIDVFGFTRYGSNDVTHILDTMIKEFKIFYYSDDGFQTLNHDPNINIKDVIKEDMYKTHRYEVVSVDFGLIKIPKRDEY